MAAVTWPVLHFISPVKIKREVYILHHEHPQDTAEVNRGHVNTHTGREINLPASKGPRVRHPNVKKTAADCLNITSIANIGQVLLTDMNAVKSRVHLTLFHLWAMTGFHFPFSGELRHRSASVVCQKSP